MLDTRRRVPLGQANDPAFYRLPGGLPLAAALRGKALVEFPVLRVLLPRELAGHALIEPAAAAAANRRAASRWSAASRSSAAARWRAACRGSVARSRPPGGHSIGARWGPAARVPGWRVGPQRHWLRCCRAQCRTGRGAHACGNAVRRSSAHGSRPSAAVLGWRA